MAAKMGLSPENPDNNPSPPDKNIEERLVPPDQLMTRLRGRVNQYRSWNDSIKALKMAVLNDKRYYSDALEKNSLQSCLDKLHRAMKIVNQQSLVERLEVIARQLGMSYTPPTAAESRLFLSADMFIVEILPDGNGCVKDVKIGHHDNSVTCEDLVEVLRKGDFEEFVTHMQGLLSIYSLHGDKKQKSKAYLALCSLESDLNVLAQLQSSISGVANYIHKSPLGILLPRRGGHPMKLIYFVSPYDLLSKKTKTSYPMTHEAITDNDLGHSVTVCLEPCATTNKLQTMPMISVKTHHHDGKSLPSFQGLNNMNSASLAASFVLVLPHPVPVSMSVINSIQEVTGLDVSYGKTKSLYSLILEQISQGKLINGTELFVTLPDQQHIYYLNDLSESCLGQPGALVTKIPFTHPTSVAKVLNFLRQQLLFNCVIQSLIRPLASHDYKAALVFELTAMSHHHLSVMFEHPLHATMMTVELDLSDITCVKCKVCMGNGDNTVCSDEFVSRAFQRCLSIPVTLRTVIERVRADVQKLIPPEPMTVKPNKPKYKWRSERVNIPCTVANTNVALTTLMAQASVDSWAHGPHLELKKYYLPCQPNMNNKFLEPPAPSEEHVEKPSANPLLATLLDQGSPMTEQHHNPVSDSPMLSKLLEEQTPVTSNPPPAFTQPKQRKLGKRKSSKDVLSGKLPKQRQSDSDIHERIISERHGQGIAEKRIDLDSSVGSFEGDPIRPPSVSSVGSIGGQSSTGSIIDLTDIGESHVKKLEYSLDNIMMKEARMGNMNLNMGMNNQMGGTEGMDFQMPHMTDLHHSQNPHMGDGSDFIHHPQWGSHPTPPRPTSRNSPHHSMVPKNETASTSLEGNLIGPGDGRDTQGPNPTHCRRNSGHSVRLSSYRRQSSRTSIDSNMSDLVSPDVFSPSSKSPVHHPLASPHRMVSPSHSSTHSSTVTSPIHHPTVSPSHFLSNIKSEPGALVSTPISMTSPRHSMDSRCGTTSPRHSIDSKVEMTSPRHSLDSRSGMSPRHSLDSKSGILPLTGFSNSMAASFAPCSTPSPVLYSSGKPSLSALKAQLEMKNDIVNSGFISSQEKDGIKSEERVLHPVGMKLRLNMKHINDNVKHYDNVSPPESDKSRSSMFDFHSDDEEFSLPHLEKSMTVISSSPTRLQISNKNKLVHSLKFNKTEKYKRKESKKNSTGDSSKRKRDKDESKKEKKRKKVSNNSYCKINDNAVYKSTTVTVEGVGDNNLKPMPRLKITKSGVNFESATVVPVERNPHAKEDVGMNIKTENQTNTAVSAEKIETSYERMEAHATEMGNVADKIESQLPSGINAENNRCDIGQIETNLEKKEISALSEERDSSTNEIKTDFEDNKSISMNTTAVKNDQNSDVKFEKNALQFTNHSETLENLLKEGVDVTIGENVASESVLSGLLNKEMDKAVKEKSVGKNESIRNASVSSEGIFDKIAAMKTEILPENENVIDLSKDSAVLVNPKKAILKSQKLLKAQQHSSSHTKEDKKGSGKTPTVKLKPVVFPSTTSTQPLTSSTNVLSNSSVAKTISASPTSTTIGKIGAVSLATSGSQKHLTQTNKSPQSSNKPPSKGSSGAILSKSVGNLQKTVQITGTSGKNSPILQTGSKSGGFNSNKSTSLSSLSSKSDKSVEKTARASLSGNRTSSPLLGREKDGSKSRSSSGSRDRDRERDKSTSSSKTSTPVPSALKQETAASVLSFLNPKAGSIAKLPPIPKKFSSTDSAKNSPTTNSTGTTSPVVTSSNSVSQNTSARTVSSGAASNPKGKNVQSKPNHLNRQLNNAVSNTGNRAGNNSPVNYSTKNHSNSYSNKNSNSNASNSRTNSANSSSNVSRVNSGQNASNVPSNRGNNSSQNSRGNAFVNNQSRGVTHNNNNSNRMNSANNVPSNTVSNRSNISGTNVTHTQGNKNIASVPNAPRGPGPPASSNTPDEHSKVKHSAHQAIARGRKSSLSAVIDKLTCKVSVPTSEANKQNKTKVERVVIDEPPASPEPDAANDKVANKKEKAKVVINESPESPEPENKNGPGVTAQRNERTKSEGSIVSIPLDKQVSRSPDITKQGNRISGHRQNMGAPEKGKLNRPGNLPFSNSSGVKNKMSPSPTQSPISIPLTPKSLTPKLNDYQTPIRNKPNHQVLKKQNSIENLKSHHEDTNGEVLEDEDLRIILNQKPPQGYCSTPGVPSSNRSRDSTPVDLSATRQSPSMMNDKSKENKFVTPVSRSLSADRQNEDSENRIGQRKSRPNSRPTLSPESPCSSPDNGLIIDVDSSPKHILSKTNSPLCNQDGIRKDFRTSPNFLKAVKSSPLSKIRPSPGTSPTSKERMSDSSSPCFLDDDLMDEALIGDGVDG